MARPVTPFESVLREALRPRCVLDYRPSTRELWDWDPSIDGWVTRNRPRANRDFIFTPLFTSILGAANITLFGNVTLASALSAVATTALTIGLQYALAPKPPKPEDGRQPLVQAVPYRFWGVGETRLAGAYMLWEASGPMLVSVQALVAHKIDSITAYYLNDDKVTLDSGGGVNAVPGKSGRYRSGGDQSRSLVHISTRLGNVPETAYSEVVALFGAQGIWTNDHRGDGQASLAMICETPGAKDFTSRFPYNKPAASIVGKLALVWDFRDPAQSPTNPATWTWSNNPVLILAWHLCFNPFGEKHDYTRAILPVLDMWQEEADVCDESVPLAIGGTERRYTCSGYDTTEHGPKAGANAILATMDGWTCTRGDGAILVVAGKYREKYCVTLTDADVVGYTNQRDVMFDEEVNRFTPKFNYPATDYTTTDTDFFEDIPAQIKAGRVLPEEGHYDWCTQWRQARRLGKRDWIRLQQKSRGSVYANLTGINAVYAPWIRLQTPVMIPALAGKVISNRKATIDLMKGGFQIDFIKMPDNPANIDAWNPAIDEGEAPPIPIVPETDPIPVPDIDTVAAVSSGGSVYIQASIVDPQRDDLTPVVRYRLAAVGGGQPGAWVEQQFPDVTAASGLLLLNTNPAPNDKSVEVEVAFIGSDNTYGDWSVTRTVVTTVDTVAPQGLLTYSASNGTGKFTVNFSTQNDIHLATVAIYRVSSGGTLNRATDLIANPAVSPGISYAIPVTSSAGSWKIYAEPMNRSGIAGPLSGPSTVAVS